MKRKIFLFSSLLAGFSVLITSILITIAAYNDSFKTVKQEVIASASYINSGIQLVGTDYLNQIDLQQQHRITLISPDGTVLYDSDSNPDHMDNHFDRPEIQEARSKGTGESTRFSNTLREKTYYYAISMQDGSVLRLANATASIISSYDRLFWLVALVALMGFLISASIASLVTRRIVRPINTIDLDNPEQSETYDEIVPLLTKIKNQRNQISQQMKELDRQRVEFSAITENMNEGLFVLDKDGIVLSYNKSALKLLHTQAIHPIGMNILSLNRSNQIVEVIQAALKGTFLERILEIGGRQCQIFVSPVKNENIVQGMIILLMDVTEKQDREKLRHEFTSNVSHELKTPLTVISGCAEIIMNGVVKPEDIPEFSQNIYDESKRLIALVEDLMLLSKLEESTPPQKEPVNLLNISKDVASRLTTKAKEFDVTVLVSGDSAEMDGLASVLNEMVYNLLDNAIKYNRKGGKVSIDIKNLQNEIILQVSDTGIGIPETEQTRIFERFYRVDKSHNKAIEGTGLGLAIVKHGAALHDAVAKLESSHEGSTFSFIFKKQGQLEA